MGVKIQLIYDYVSPKFYFPATPSSTATLLWLLRCYPNDLTGIVILNKTIYSINLVNSSRQLNMFTIVNNYI